MTEQFDFIVIGGGSGGIAAARKAAQYAAKVALVESGALGGTCVNVGCVPKKVMWNAAQIGETIRLAKDYGFQPAESSVNWAALQAARDAYVARLNQIYQDNLAKAAVTLVRGHAQMVAPSEVAVGSRRLRAAHILLATGSRPSRVDIPGAEAGISSNGFFELKQQPKQVLVIGAGYIATELAGLLHGLGSHVTMLLRKDRLLRNFDQMLSDTVMQQMQAAGVEILCNQNLRALVRLDSGRLACRTEQQQFGDYDCVLWAVGRHANSADLNLSAAGVEVDQRGFITTDAYQNTTAPGVYAVGDVTAQAALTPVAIAAGRRLAERLFDQQTAAKLDYSQIPTVVFSHPPIATIGLSEAQAEAEYAAAHIQVYQSEFVNMRYALSDAKPSCKVKLVTAGANARIVGCHVVGDAADEMLQGFAVAIKMGATKADFDNTIAIHPTAAEELVTLG